jgi:hypothetical protein
MGPEAKASQGALGLHRMHNRRAETGLDKEEAPETGGSGLLRFLMGGTCDGEGKTRHCNLDSQPRRRFNPALTPALGLEPYGR